LIGRLHPCRALAAGLLVSACTESNPAFRGARVTDGAADGPAADAGPSTDGPPDASVDSPVGVDGGPDGLAACGSAVPDIAAIAGSDGLVVAPDGTIYFTRDDGTDGWVGRMLPGQAPRSDWLRLEGAPIMTGLAHDPGRDRLYVASVSEAAILTFQLSGSGLSRSTLIGNIIGINDLALDAAGDIYFTRQSDGHVHRVSPQGQSQQVTSARLGDSGMEQFPAGLAFGPDGSLFVGLKNGGGIIRLTLTAGLEQARSTFGTFRGWANGLAFDSSGRLYAGIWNDTVDARLVRIAADGSNPVDVYSDGRYSSLAFGRGSLDCRDLYIAQPFGPLRRLRTDTPGL
jgi:sugar lactone lactonase YvrE